MSIFTIPGINVTSASARRIFSKRMGSGQLHVQLYATSLPPFRRQHFRHSLDVSVYSIQMDREWCLREASRYNFSLLWPWSLTSCTPTSTIHALASGRGDLCGFALKSVNLFWKYSIHKLARVERTNRRRDRSRTLYVRPASLDWRTDKFSIQSLLLLHSCVFMMWARSVCIS